MKYYTWILSFLCAAVCFVAAACEPESPNHDGGDSTGNIDAGETGSVDADWLPKIENIPDYYWEVTDLLYDSDRNSLDPGNPDFHLLFFQDSRKHMAPARKDQEPTELSRNYKQFLK